MLKIKWIINTLMLYAGMVVWFYACVAVTFGYEATRTHSFALFPVGGVVAAFLAVGILLVNRGMKVKPIATNPKPMVLTKVGPMGELIYFNINQVMVDLRAQYHVRNCPAFTAGLINGEPYKSYTIRLVRMRASLSNNSGYDKKELVKVLQLNTNEHGYASVAEAIDLTQEMQAVHYFYYIEEEELGLCSSSNMLCIY